MSAISPRHFIAIADHSNQVVREIFDLATSLKARWKRGETDFQPLKGRMLAMIFDQPSTRTRISFDVAMRQLGGDVMALTGQEMQLGRGESIADTARVLSRLVSAVMIRTLDPTTLDELASHATIPVINGLTEIGHPCQIMADIMTYEEHRGPIAGKKIAWSGSLNNVLVSWAQAAEILGFDLAIAVPDNAPDSFGVRNHLKHHKRLSVHHDPFEAVDGADGVATDCWISMGEDESESRHNLMQPYQVNEKLMSTAQADALFLHCLPAHRGEEVTDAVIDGPHSVVFDIVENRLHAQKGILAWCLNAEISP